MATVTRSGAQPYDVHIGFWTNWAHDRVAGATLTLTRRNGGLLIAFLAIFVTMVGKSFWRTTCYLLHRYFSSHDPHDALHHQRQSLLRNTETAESAIWPFSRVVLAWRKKRVQRLYARFLPAIVLSAIITIGFIFAGIFSSRVTPETANEVLLTGSRCAVVQVANESYTHPPSVDRVNTYYAERIQAYLNYAQQCYTDAQNSEDCSQYVRPSLPLQINRRASCPFDESICKSTDANVLIETDFLNSNHDLGVNMPPHDQFLLRFRTHCAPLLSKGNTSVSNNTAGSPGSLTRYYYGSAGSNHTTQSRAAANQDALFVADRLLIRRVTS
jgi:hypothetical protein